MKKKGSHIGFVLSFAIFVTFVVFIYATLAPLLKDKRNSEGAIENIKDNLANKLKTEVNSTTVRINSSFEMSGNCVEFQGLSNSIEGNFLTVKDDNGILRKYEKNSGNVEIEIPSSVKYLKIYSAYGLNYSEKPLSGCAFAEVGKNYTIGLVKNEIIIVEKKIIDYVTKQDSDYNSLKSELGVPVTRDFMFGFKFYNGSVLSEIGPAEKNISRDLFVDEISVQYLNSTADLNQGFVNIKVW